MYIVYCILDSIIIHYWHIGILVYWCIAILAYWYIGVLVYWYIGTLWLSHKGGDAWVKRPVSTPKKAYWHIGILAYWENGVFVYLDIRDFLGNRGIGESRNPQLNG